MINLLNKVNSIELRQGDVGLDHYELVFFYELGELIVDVFANISVTEGRQYHSDVHDYETEYDVKIGMISILSEATFFGQIGESTLMLNEEMRMQCKKVATEKLESCDIELLISFS